MADLSTIEDALVALVGAALYPDGTGSPSAAGGIPCKVYRGWPVGKKLDDDLKAGIAHVSLSSTGVGGNITMFLDEWRTVARAPWPMTATLAETVGGLRVSLSGASEDGLCVGMRLLRVPYVAPLVAADTPATAAAKLAAIVPGAVATGADIDLPWSPGAEARVGGRVATRREATREEDTYRFAVWASTPQARDTVAAIVARAVKTVDWLEVEGEEDARLLYQGTATLDDAGESRVFRRDVNVRVEYATYEEQTVPTVLFGVTVVHAVAYVEG